MIDEILKLAIADNYYDPKDMYDALVQIHKLASGYKNRMVEQFIKAFEVAKQRNWDRIYIGIDIHETVLKPTWSKELSTEYYDCAMETLKLMSEHKMVCLILWSCSLPEYNKKYKEVFEKDGIKFDYINENPECSSTDYADFDSKLYFSVGMDDKFGFIPTEDWKALQKYFETLKND